MIRASARAQRAKSTRKRQKTTHGQFYPLLISKQSLSRAASHETAVCAVCGKIETSKQEKERKREREADRYTDRHKTD